MFTVIVQTNNLETSEMTIKRYVEKCIAAETRHLPEGVCLLPVADGWLKAMIESVFQVISVEDGAVQGFCNLTTKEIEIAKEVSGQEVCQENDCWVLLTIDYDGIQRISTFLDKLNADGDYVPYEDIEYYSSQLENWLGIGEEQATELYTKFVETFPKILSRRLTHKYVGEYKHLDQWENIGLYSELSRKRIHEDFESFEEEIVVEVQSNSSDEEIEIALTSTFSACGCSHEHDCCGCWSTRVVSVTGEGKKRTVQVHGSKNV